MGSQKNPFYYRNDLLMLIYNYIIVIVYYYSYNEQKTNAWDLNTATLFFVFAV